MPLYPVVTIDGVVCCDCGGAVECYAVPDAVWDGLGYSPGDFACVACLGFRLNPKLAREHVKHWLPKELHRQRRKFGLHGKTSFTSMKVRTPSLFVPVVSDEVGSIPKAAAINRG